MEFPKGFENAKNVKSTLKEIITEYFPSLQKDTNIQVREGRHGQQPYFIQPSLP